MYLRQKRYVKRRHSGKSSQWCHQVDWRRFNLERQDNWVFGDKTSGAHLLKFAWFTIERHVLVKGTTSMDDPTLKQYWQHRQKAQAKTMKPSRQRLAKRQNGKCPVCGESLLNGEEIQLHHKQPKAQGGQDTLENLVLLHLFCHQQVHHRSPS
jgi:RNA-directed DNA polymerase